jgi:hypothetical protein
MRSIRAAHNLGSFGHRVRRIERLGEAINFAAIELGQLGMEPQHRCGLAGTEAHFGLGLLLLQCRKVGSDGGGVPAILNDSDDGGQLPLDLDECPLNGKALAEMARLRISALKASTKAAISSGATSRSLSPLKTRSSSSWRPISSVFVQIPFERCAAQPYRSRPTIV